MTSIYFYLSFDLILLFLLSLTYFYYYSFLKLILLLEGGLILISLLFLTISISYDNPEGLLMALFILGAAAGETSLGLSIFVKNEENQNVY